MVNDLGGVKPVRKDWQKITGSPLAAAQTACKYFVSLIWTAC
jgi:hypothetical protein